MSDVAICDSSPLIALQRIGHIDLLRHAYPRILIPAAVSREVAQTPPWITVMQPAATLAMVTFPPKIHEGEADVFRLASQIPKATLILDDLYARQYAHKQGFACIGTIGVILRCKRFKRIDAVTPILDSLQNSGFHVSEDLRNEVLRLAGE